MAPSQGEAANAQMESPESRANFVSILFWSWVSGFINLGSRKTLQFEDLFQLIPSEKSEWTINKWNNLTESCRENKRDARNLSVWKVLWMFYWREFCLAALWRPVFIAAIVVQVYSLKAIVRATGRSGSIESWWAALLVLSMFATSIVQSVAQHQCFTRMQKLGMKIRSLVTYTVFEKTLSLPLYALSGSSQGQMLNLITNDTQKLLDTTTYFHFVWSAVIEMCVVCALVYAEVGVAAIPGMILLVLIIPLQIWMARQVGRARKPAVKLTDARVQLVGEALAGVRVVKYNGWVAPFLERMDALREQELRWIRMAAYFRAANSILKDIVTPLACLLTFGTYVGLHRGQLQPDQVFAVLAFFSILVRVFFIAPQGLQLLTESFVSIKRLETFLRLPGSRTVQPSLPASEAKDVSVSVQKGNFRWQVSGDGPGNGRKDRERAWRWRWKERMASNSQPEGSAGFQLKDINLLVKRGERVAITGRVGSGKSSLLLALLQEMEMESGSLSLSKPVGYASQQPWIFNATVRDNILFGLQLDPERYASVCAACALHYDFNRLPHGDLTEIGERGVNLSGGQKSRVGLARALYCQDGLLLLDDPLAAVDARTASHMMGSILGGSHGQSLLMVSHSMPAVQRCDRAVVMESGCLLEKEKEEVAFLLPSAGQDSREGQEEVLGQQEDAPAAPLTVAEDRKEGVVSGKTYLAYIMGFGGWSSVLLLCAVFLLSQSARTYLDYWLGAWADSKYSLPSGAYVAIFAALTACTGGLSLLRVLLFTWLALRSARTLHKDMAAHVLRAPLLFFDQNPVGRILNRFSKDQAMVDELLPYTAQVTLELLIGSLGSLVMIAVLVPWVMLCVPPLFIMSILLQRRYTRVSRELKQLDGLSRSPLYAHFNQHLQGIVTVRAFAAGQRVLSSFVDMLDINHQAYILFVHTGRWLGVRLDLYAAVCVTVTALSVILLRHSLPPGIAGVALVQSLQLSGFLQYGVRQAAEAENLFTSVERIHSYTQIDPESSHCGGPGESLPPDWPESGGIQFEDVYLAYSVGLPHVLKGLSFTISGGERVGIVGRTGAGKSSLAAALFRMVHNADCRGRVVVDGRDIQQVDLDTLRQRLSIIPQDPTLFKGTIRENLDPFGQHSDDIMMESVRQVHLGEKIAALKGGLSSSMAENGDNFSVGERQLFCLARALLRKSKIIVMDEATAAVDGETDRMIQRAMRELFAGCTQLIIAHRIHSVIDCHRVMLLKDGVVAEFDSPQALLARDSSLFAAMVDQTGAVEAGELRRKAAHGDS